MEYKELINITIQLTNFPTENEWVEFKTNNYAPDEIGKRISALSNGACLKDQRLGYLIFGIEDNILQLVNYLI